MHHLSFYNLKELVELSNASNNERYSQAYYWNLSVPAEVLHGGMRYWGFIHSSLLVILYLLSFFISCRVVPEGENVLLAPSTGTVDVGRPNHVTPYHDALVRPNLVLSPVYLNTLTMGSKTVVCLIAAAFSFL